MENVERSCTNVQKYLSKVFLPVGTRGVELRNLVQKQTWNSSDLEQALTIISQLLLHPLHTVAVARAFRPLLLDVLCRVANEYGQSDRQHQYLSVALSKLIGLSQDVESYSVKYFLNKSLFLDEESIEPVAKKTKKSKSVKLETKDLLRSAWLLAKRLTPELRQHWNWTVFLKYLRHNDIDIRWYAAETCCLLLSLPAAKCRAFIMVHFTSEEIRKLSIKHNSSCDVAKENILLLCNEKQPGMEDDSTHTRHSIITGSTCDEVVSVCGVLLPRMPSTEKVWSSQLVGVASTCRNLHSLALAVAASRPVLLEGPVGAGKTALVEHLANITGRGTPPLLTKLQLGDQTDSKALLGTYHCTDVPGEFVWRPGALTVAVTSGHWLLLEDLDYAPLDVTSLLVPLLESRTLSIPGHGDQVLADPGFRIFATQRLLTSSTGFYRQRNMGGDMLDKLWTRVTVEPLSRTELEEVIKVKFSQLTTIVDRILDVYFLLSAGRHELSGVNSDDMDVETDDGKFLTHEGRLISTRDLLKWCSRIAVDFEANQHPDPTMVFSEALDCFCACVSSTKMRLSLAEAIGAKININKVNSVYYCNQHKPSIQNTVSQMIVGRACVEKLKEDVVSLDRSGVSSNFAFTRQATSLLEKVAVCVRNNEAVLLVGETGTGKTSSVQYLAQQTGHRLRVINMSQQSDTTDLLGGFKPVDIRFVVGPFREEFELAFCSTFSRKQNIKFLSHIQDCYGKQKWLSMLKLMQHSQKSALKKVDEGSEMSEQWRVIGHRLKQLKQQIKKSSAALAFSFIEGALVKALKKGEWVLLDEINLATAETLECLSSLLESTSGSVVLVERGDVVPIVRHPDFRLFACMNPATDVGKRDLPPGVRNRFTEFFVDELVDKQDLQVLVAEYLKGLSLPANQLAGIVTFYKSARQEAKNRLTDGTGHKPHYSLRTFCRGLRQAATNMYGTVGRSLYEGLCLSFLTQLDRKSHPIVTSLIREHVLGKNKANAILQQALPQPPGHKRLQFEGYWLHMGREDLEVPDGYVLTPSVRANLKDLARIVSAGRYPVLLQGETSVGKTSMITWLARSSGNTCLRINNHEHTDLQEYIGCYAADHTGRLVFKDGVLVEAMRRGCWIILDELNLAPTDVLEALNRLLDDNRELFIPETQEVIKAHPQFLLFATQNPPGLYGGRKVLSRAFRNRFVELHFDEIPSSELETILHERCLLPMSYCKKLVAIMLELQKLRRGSGLFAGKQGFITLRDLFRWAERYRLASSNTKAKYFDWDQQLAENGYMLLAGRVRRPEEAEVIVGVIHKHLKRRVDPNTLFTVNQKTSPTTAPILQELIQADLKDFSHVVWTYNMRRMAALVGQALKFGEPVLLVGETGCGKTTVCQAFSCLHNQQLYTVNCHMHTESADFLGGLRPVRQRAEDSETNLKLFEWCDGPLVTSMKTGAMFLIDEISLADDSVLERLNSVLEPERTLLLAEKGVGDVDDGHVEEVVAEENFRLIATMNPGGDYGKKELSPALRNRFTEIWCSQITEADDMISIIEHNLEPGIHLTSHNSENSGLGKAILEFVQWFANNDFGRRSTISIRDLLCWVHFINATVRPSKHNNNGDMEVDSPQKAVSQLSTPLAYIHGACMIFLDALGSGMTSGGSGDAARARTAGLNFMLAQVKQLTGKELKLSDVSLAELQDERLLANQVVRTSHQFGIDPFYISTGPNNGVPPDKYALTAPTTCVNAQRLLRGLQLPRALLLEGSPGVGKTSLVSAIAKSAGHTLVRINLSEQTDVSDLFGADLPVEGGAGGEFAWRDGSFLAALKQGHWIVLDELNLASQSVLEGLNACLDHRAEVYVPELARSFQVQHEKTRIFACQNPLKEGGGRKGLPKSFLNRFTQVYVEPLSRADLMFITRSMYENVPEQLLENMVDFNNQVQHETMSGGVWGQRGAPWEFNLRDIFRWCDLLQSNQTPGNYRAGDYMHLVYSDRMRSAEDRQIMMDIFTRIFVDEEVYIPCGSLTVTLHSVQVGQSFLPRVTDVLSPAPSASSGVNPRLQLLHHIMPSMESLMKCIEMQWMAIMVGPSCTGKTSLVQLLAQLTGQTLHILPMNSSMDTTELLGGFEQSDVNRHMERLLRRVQSLLEEVTAEKLLSNQNGVFKRIERMWTAWKNVNKVTDVDCEGEFDEMKMKVTSVKQMLILLTEADTTCNTTYQEELAWCEHALQQIEQESDRGGRGGGGSFEWIDSVLVEALREGHWLLIDNVNFCSPSVLDRLNALLEPGGVLTISERGVIDGQVPTVSPHPQFRLILAMDPRHGEISRAMRNRGVEIYMLGEEEGGAYSEMDLKRMLHSCGVTGRLPCEKLLEVHRAIQSDSYRTDRPTLAHLLRAGLLAWQKMDRGMDVNTALTSSCFEVYVRGHKDLSRKQIFCDTITSQFSDWDMLAWEAEKQVEIRSALVEASLWPHKLADVHDWCADVTMSTVQNHCMLLLYLLTKLEVAIGIRTDMPLTYHHLQENEICDHELNKKEVQHLTPQIYIAIKMIAEKTSAANWLTVCEWLKVTIEPRIAFCLTHMALDVSVKEDLILSHLLDTLLTSLNVVFTHPLVSVAQEEIQKLVSNEQEWLDFGERPVDLRWDSHLLDRLLHHPVQDLPRGENPDQSSTHIFGCANQLHIVQDLAMFHCLYKTCPVKQPKKQQRAGRSLLQLSMAIHTGDVAEENVPHAAVRHLAPFMECIVTELTKTLNHPLHLTNEHTQQVMENLMWYKRLIELCARCLTNNDQLHAVLPRLALHWTWFYDLCYKPLSDKLCFSSKLITIVARLHSLLGIDSEAARLFAELRKKCGHPAAFRNEETSEMSLLVAEQCEAIILNKMTKRKTEDEIHAIRFHVEQGKNYRESLHRVILALAESDKPNLDHERETLTRLREQIVCYGIIQDQPDCLAMDTDTGPSGTQPAVSKEVYMAVGLWPVMEEVFLRELQAILPDCLQRHDTEEEGAARTREGLAALNWMMAHLPVSPAFHLSLRRALARQDEDTRTLHNSIVYDLFQHIETSTATNRVHKWLVLQPGSTPHCENYEPSIPQTEGVSCVFSGRTTQMMFTLLTHGAVGGGQVVSRAEKKPAKSAVAGWVAGQIPLDTCQQKVQQLSQLQQYIWVHAPMWNCHKWDAGKKSLDLLCVCAERLFEAMMTIGDITGENGLSPSTPLSRLMSQVVKLVQEQNRFKSLLPTIHDCVNTCVMSLQDCLSKAKNDAESDVAESRNNRSEKTSLEQERILALGKAWTHFGLLQSFLLVPQGPIDPVEQLTSQLTYAELEERDVSCELELRSWEHELMTGRSLLAGNASRRHPLLSQLTSRQHHLVSTISTLQKQVAHRPDPPQYGALLQECRQYLSSHSSTDRVLNLLNKANTALTSNSNQHIDVICRELQAWCTTTKQFVNRAQHDYPLYPDVLQPFLTAVLQVHYGLGLVVYILQARSQQHQLVPDTVPVSQRGPVLESVIRILCRLPCQLPGVSTSLTQARDLTATKTTLLLRHLANARNNSDPSSQPGLNYARGINSVLRAGLLHLRNHLILVGRLDQDSLLALSDILQQYVLCWQRAEEDKRRREEEKAALYKYKVTSHGDERSEDQQDADAIKQAFPSYQEEFLDVTVGVTLEQQDEPVEENTGDMSDSGVNAEMTLDMMSDVSGLHGLLTSLTVTNWHQEAPPSLTQTDHIEPALTCYNVAAEVSDQAQLALSHAVDGDLMAVHLLVSCVQQNKVTDKDSTLKVTDKKPFDIYHDPCVSEAVQCLPVLEKLTLRVNELLSEWPEHPTLTQLTIVITRILRFPVTSPLLKFITGLEVLLEKSQVWERDAARHVSLAEHLTSLSLLIIQWRKLELSCWKSCLDSVVWHAHQGASRWWFHLYSLVQDFLSVIENEENEGKGTNPEKLLESLQRFMEESPLGEYTARLDMLLAFHCQLIHMETSEKQDTLKKIFWNVHQFYAHFRQDITEAINHQTKPIEKELKAFVKIARWNDVNFYALRQAVEKTHYKLHKHIKQMKAVLEQSVKCTLTENVTDWTASSEAQSHTESSDVTSMMDTLTPPRHQVPPFPENVTSALLCRLPSLGKKLHLHCCHLVKTLPYLSLTGSLDNLTGEVIDVVHELSALDASQIEDKEKQKSEAKHHHLRKRKALADLFKELQSMGLSYRRGLHNSNTEGQSLLLHMSSSPANLHVAVKQLEQLEHHRAMDEACTKHWIGCEKYHHRCLSRRAMLHSALQSPSKDLGLANIERLKGFSENLMTIVSEEWTHLCSMTDHFLCLRKLTNSMRRLSCNVHHKLPSQYSTKQQLVCLKKTCDRLVDSLQQVDVLLRCCPSPPPDGRITSPVPSHYLPKLAFSVQQDELWTNAVAIVQDASLEAVSMKQELDKEVATGLLLTWREVDMMERCCNRLIRLCPALETLQSHLCQPSTRSESALSQPISLTLSSVKHFLSDFTLWREEQLQPPVYMITSEETPSKHSTESEVVSQYEQLLATLLLAVQNMLKHHKLKEAKEDANVDDTDTGDGLVQEGHITRLLVKPLNRDLAILQINKVCEILHDLLALVDSNVSVSSQITAAMTRSLLPLLEQYSHLAQLLLTMSVATHRSTAKMLSVLLAIFLQLAQKGFCLPADYEEEADGEGSTQFEDIEGGGLGEGEGAKDVSDQIESEDQLDDAHRRGEEKKEEDQQDKPDIAPEDNAIEMSDDIEGKEHDREPQEKDGDDSDAESELDENELDKQMGDLDGKDADKLDEQVWGSDDEQEEEKKDTKEEDGAGDGKQTESEMVAKDDNKKGSEAGEQKEEQKEETEEKEQQPHELQQDEGEFDENEVDDEYNKKEKEEKIEEMDLTEDLNLDKNETGDQEEGTEDNSESPDNIPDTDEGKPQEEDADKDAGEDENKDAAQDEDNDGSEQPQEEEGGDDSKQEEPMEVEDEQDTKQEENTSPDDGGTEPQEDSQEKADDESHKSLEEEQAEAGEDQANEEAPPPADMTGRTSHDTQAAEQADTAHDTAASLNEQDQHENDGLGKVESNMEQGHQGDQTSSVTQRHDSQQQEQQHKPSQRKPGESRHDRSLGSVDEKTRRRLKTVDVTQSQPEQAENNKKSESELYEHIQDSQSHHDAQTLDVATAEQQEEQVVPDMEDEPTQDKPTENPTQPDDTHQIMEEINADKLTADKMQPSSEKDGTGGDVSDEDDVTVPQVTISGDKVDTYSVERGPQTSYHTSMEEFNMKADEVDVEQLRRQLEEQLSVWSQSERITPEEEQAAQLAWQKYEALTAPLSQELCEQLRLVLEPTQASKLRGDYRTGKRLNMRKVIPYIASQFRKDKIWLRRTRPSKREYQVMLAVDDSASMADNHSKQLAFESLAVVSNALTLLEVGELAVCSFGETVKMLHHFQEQFSSQSGGRILQQFNFQQQKTKIAQLLQHMMVIMNDCRRQRSTTVETSQLLLVVSDGRGLFLEGMDTMTKAVRQAREANIFLVFIVIDNPDNKNSIMDIKVPIFTKSGGLPEITSYMDHFPFPFYLILRDINSLPHILSDALRQWFELVTASDK